MQKLANGRTLAGHCLDKRLYPRVADGDSRYVARRVVFRILFCRSGCTVYDNLWQRAAREKEK